MASAQRAVHCWSRVTDVGTLLETGPPLSALVASTLGSGSGTARYVRTRLTGHTSDPSSAAAGTVSEK
ncbi:MULTISPECIES: hypothetical protein [unclassified Streptomyces]|uniref:hypothetical protein n=1 Tax=unclassified Streptomyces TaxID=2593676 RepID=UPI0036591107